MTPSVSTRENGKFYYKQKNVKKSFSKLLFLKNTVNKILNEKLIK